MITWWEALPLLDQILSGMAIGFGSLLTLLLLLSLFGGEADLDFETDIDMDGGGGQGSFSIKTMLSFLTFFGFGGWSALAFGAPLWLVFVVAVIVGYTCMSLLALMLVYLMRLGHDGGRDVQSVLQQRGEVYLLIPAKRQGNGLIHVKMGSRLVELEAVTNGAEIASGKLARVVQILGENRVLVEEMPTTV
ncbi:MAG: hypothetical protein AB8F78_12610 [Saprospiraceae bacterium]